MDVRIIRSEVLDRLADAASRSPRRRQHVNLHASFDEPCQRLFNAIGHDSYIRPHRHLADPKTETLIAVRGAAALVTFDDSGRMHEVVAFGATRDSSDGTGTIGVELAPATWHTVIALTRMAVVLELKDGPFNPNAAKELADWAPAEGSPGADRYLADLEHEVLGRLGRQAER